MEKDGGKIPLIFSIMGKSWMSSLGFLFLFMRNELFSPDTSLKYCSILLRSPFMVLKLSCKQAAEGLHIIEINRIFGYITK